MTIPTKLSLSRILLTFVIMGCLFTPGLSAKVAAWTLFLFASFTDWLDGYLARRWQQTSSIGALLDPIADKVLVLGMFLAFLQLRLIPAWMVLLIALREFLITGVRLLAANRHIVLPAAREGKHKTASQMVAIVVTLTILIAQEFRGVSPPSAPLDPPMRLIVSGCMWVALLLTIVSGANFFWRHRHLLRDVATAK